SPGRTSLRRRADPRCAGHSERRGGWCIDLRAARAVVSRSHRGVRPSGAPSQRRDAVRAEDAGGVLLSLPEGGRRKRVFAAEMIEVVHMESDWDDLGTVYRLLLLQGFEQRICGETAGASFGGEQLDAGTRALGDAPRADNARRNAAPRSNCMF